ncbi:acyl-CoA thioesterase [Sporosarcina cyprini]|uniref:acyl-CoA thioesterase n=1 Tax=Sporosarcina cyprini TaxID=2910523 RepID=UPI001EDE5EE6|nr:thioesterase family protein [Sporosarcina cyprini]MCG3089318.1 acyl-CoA thioesterase [Sporosarcina cyprini]
MIPSYIGDYATWEAGFEFSVPVTVRFSETDMYGHLNNTVTFAYYEYARIEFLKTIGQMEDWLDPQGTTIPVVADLQCDYRKQVYFDETLTIYVKAASIGNSSVDLHYMSKNEKGDVVFTGRGSIVQVNRETGRAVPWTDAQKSQFQKKVAI